MSVFSIAIDGPGGAGKSSLSKRLALELNIIYVDTGAIYRTLGLYCLNHGIDCKDEDSIKKNLPFVKIEIKHEAGIQKMFLNETDVSNMIRTPEVSIAASDVSSLASVRNFLLDMQRKFAKEHSVVLDGRDIGTVVLPDADCKIFLTASAAVRAERRLKELKEKGIDQSFEDVLKDIEYRDYQDSHRKTAPLKQADDAVLIDTTNLSFEESYNKLLEVVNEKINLC